MDYEKAYKETIDKLRKLHNDWDSTQNRAAKEIELVFPELRESEGEKIRKEIYRYFRDLQLSSDREFSPSISIDEILAWLEKQGEQKPTDKVEPKFKVGDWVIAISSGNTFKILSVNDGLYRVLCYDGVEANYPIEDVDYDLAYWTIQDAKDGDVLATNNDSICIFDGTVEESKYPFAYCGLTKYGFESYDRKLPFTHDDVRPATKEQCDLLFSKMKEADYEWDAEKKELKKIEQKLVDKIGPKFNVGDWVMLDRPVLITKVEDMPYNTHQYWTSDGKWFGDATKAKLWTIQDAKDGDVLAEHETIVLFKKIEGQNIRCYCTYHYLGFNPTFYVGTLQNKDPYYPATKEQSDLLFQKMKETGYEWDAEKKELRTIEHKSLSTEETELNSLAFLTELGYTCIPPTKEKHAEWSEEDEKLLNSAISLVYEVGDISLHSWLKSIKDRVQPQPKQEWSKEDSERLDRIYKFIWANRKGDTDEIYQQEQDADWLMTLKPNPEQEWSEEDDYVYNEILKRVADKKLYEHDLEYIYIWLKSLKPNYWKPSDEQLKTLWDAIIYVEGCHSNFRGGRVLELLYNELKQL